MTNRSNEPAGKSGYPSSMEPHLSAQQATQEIKAHADEDIDALIGVLDMQKPVSRSRMTALVEMLIKETITDDAEATAKAMRAQGWETELSPDENLHELAARLTSYLSREPNMQLLNQFTHSIAKTTNKKNKRQKKTTPNEPTQACDVPHQSFFGLERVPGFCLVFRLFFFGRGHVVYGLFLFLFFFF